MTTKNVSVNQTWTKIAASTDGEIFVSWDIPVILEVATTAADTAPTVNGHLFTKQEPVTRAKVGSGFVWARLASGSRPSEIGVFVSIGAASGSGGGGSSTTTEETQLAVKTATEASSTALSGIALSLGSIDSDLGAPSTEAATSDTGSFSLTALVKRALQNWTTLLGRIPASVNGAVPVIQSTDTSVVGPSAQAAINTNLLTGTVNGWFDAGAYQSGSIQIVGSAGITAGAVIFEQTNDTALSPSGVPLRAYETSSITANPNVAAITIAANAVRLFTVPVNARYVRVRISTAFTGGTVQAFGTFSQRSATFPTVNVQQATASSMNVTATLAAATNAVGYVGRQVPLLVGDVASAAITATATTAAFTPTFGSCYEINIPVTAVSGTTPTLDVVVQESDDGGANWFNVYAFPRITATGMYRSPKLLLTGNRVRYVQTVAGTSPSFTRGVNRVQASDSVGVLRQIFDRAVVNATLNSTTASLVSQGARAVQMVLNMGAITTTAPQFQLEGSDDNGTTWYALGAALAGVASSTVQVTVANIQPQMIRARVSTAGSGATLGYVLLKAF